MPYGLTGGAIAAPTDLPGFGEIQWESMQGRDTSRPMVGGPGYGLGDGSGFDPATGFTRIATGPGPAPVPGKAGRKATNWKYALNPDSPTLWIMLFTLAAVGLIHARVNLRAGPAHAGGGIG